MLTDNKVTRVKIGKLDQSDVAGKILKLEFCPKGSHNQRFPKEKPQRLIVRCLRVKLVQQKHFIVTDIGQRCGKGGSKLMSIGSGTYVILKEEE